MAYEKHLSYAIFLKANLQHILHPLYKLKTNLQRGFKFEN